MFVSSNIGTVRLSCELSDPMLCTYQSEGAFEPQELSTRRPKWQTHQPQSERTPAEASTF